MKKPTISLACLFLAAALLGAGFVAAQGSAPAKSSGKAQSSPTTSPKTNSGATGVPDAPSATGAQPSAFPDQKSKASYAIGLNIGKGMRMQSVDVDPNILMQGLKDGLAGGKAQMTDDEVRAALMELQTEVRTKMQQKRKQENDAFLAANQAKAGVTVLPSGLQYKILTQGSGPKPTESDTVSCNYRGTLTDGTEFDSSSKHGGPVSFPVGGVIKGWTEALKLMPTGSKWQLVIPPDQAYGDEPPPGSGIPPGAVLVFDIELVSIQPKQ